MELDWNLFECEIRSAVVRIARQVVLDHPKQSFYGLALEATASDGTDEPETLEVPVLALNSEEALARDKREETGELRAFDAEVLAEHRLREVTLGTDGGGTDRFADDSASNDPELDDPDLDESDRDDTASEEAEPGGSGAGRSGAGDPARGEDSDDLPGSGVVDAELQAELDAELDGVAADIALQEAVDEDFDDGSGYYSRRWDPTDWHWCSMDLFDDAHAEAWNERLAAAVAELGWEAAARKYYRVLIDAVVAARDELARKRIPLVAFVADSDHADELLRRCLTPEQLERHFPDLEPLELDAETV